MDCVAPADGMCPARPGDLQVLAAELFSQDNIDGGLIGGAALAAESFAAIVKAALCP